MSVGKSVRRHVLVIQTVVGIVLAVGFFAWVWRYGGQGPVDKGLESVRGALYGAVAAVAGALLGFIIATLTILVGLVNTDSPRMEYVRRAPSSQQIWLIFTSTIKWLAAATAVGIVALLLDHEKGVIPDGVVQGLRAVVLGVGLIAAARLLLAMWVLEQVVKLANKPLTDHPAH